MSRDPWVHLASLPPQIQSLVEAALHNQSGDRTLRLGRLRLAVAPPIRMRHSAIRALLARQADLATQATQAHRQKVAELEAQQQRDIAHARADSLSGMSVEDRALLAAQLAATAEAEAKVARQHDLLLAERDKLAAELKSAVGERDRLRVELHRINRCLTELARVEAEAVSVAKKALTHSRTMEQELQAVSHARDTLQRQLSHLAAQIRNLTERNRTLEASVTTWRQIAAQGARDAAQAFGGAKWK